MARLEFRQQTEHLALKDEKTLIQQIEKVRASKKLLGALLAKQGGFLAARSYRFVLPFLLPVAEVAKALEDKKLATQEMSEKVNHHKLKWTHWHKLFAAQPGR